MWSHSPSFASTLAAFWRLVTLNVAGAFLSCLNRSVTTMTEAEILSRLPRLPKDITATATDTGKYIAIGFSRGKSTRRVTIIKAKFERSPVQEAFEASEFLIASLDAEWTKGEDLR